MPSGHDIGRCGGVIARQQAEARWKPRPQAHRARDITGSVPQPDELRRLGQPLHRRVSQLAGSPCGNVVEDDRERGGGGDGAEMREWGATDSTASAPARSACLVNSIARSVELDPAPAMILARPCAV